MFLSRILEDKKREVAERSARKPQPVLEREARLSPPPRDFRGALRAPGLSVIAEVKRASPSKGPIRPDLDAATLALDYQAGGCSAISVLTDQPHFGARPDDLQRVREAVAVPVLRKDFVISEYQVWESRGMGADAFLLIVAALDAESLARYMRLGEQLRMCPLVEVHSAAELGTAVECGARLIGINNRDLQSFRVDLETTRRLLSLRPEGTVVVSESGISGPADASRVREWGVDAILVGEALVRSSDPSGLLRSLRVKAGGNDCHQDLRHN